MIAAGCSQDKIRIQRTGIPTSEFRYRLRAFPDEGRFQFLQACRLIEKKGVEVTLRAFAEFLQRWPNSRLAIAGDGPLRGPLKQLADQLQISRSVEFTGFLGKKVQLLSRYLPESFFCSPKRDYVGRRQRRDSEQFTGSNGHRSMQHCDPARRYPGSNRAFEKWYSRGGARRRRRLPLDERISRKLAISSRSSPASR